MVGRQVSRLRILFLNKSTAASVNPRAEHTLMTKKDGEDKDPATKGNQGVLKLRELMKKRKAGGIIV